MAMLVKKVPKDYSVLKAERLYPAPPSLLYKVEGQDEMIPYTAEELRRMASELDARRPTSKSVVDGARALAQRMWNSPVEDDTLNLQKWLCSFTFFGEKEELVRVVRHRGKRNVVVGKIWRTMLLPHESFSPGCYEETKALCIERNERSLLEREANKEKQGKLYPVENKYPESWEAHLSTQKPLKGVGKSGRPLTFIQLMARDYVSSNSRGASKFVDQAVPEITMIPCANKRPLAPLAKVEDSIDFVNWYNIGPSCVKKLVSKLPTNPLSILVGKESSISIGEYKSLFIRRDNAWSDSDPLVRNPHETRDTARYLSWLRNPEQMRRALRTDRYNFSFATESDIRKFDQLLESIKEPDFNVPLSVKLHVEDIGKATYKRKINFVLIGRPIKHKVSTLTPIKNTAISYGLLKPYIDPAGVIGRVGLDTMPPMSEMEYESITRIAPCDIDKELLDRGLISVSQYSSGDDAREWAHISYVLKGKDKELIYFDDLFYGINKSIQRSVKPSYPEVTVPMRRPAANDAVYVDSEIKPDKVNANWTEVTADVVKSGSKMVLNWVVKKLTDV